MAAALRFASTSWVSGYVLFGDPGFGVLAQNIASSGDSGPGYAYASLTLPADNGKQICGRITTPPAHGTLTADEDTSFIYDGNGTADSAMFQLYVDGVAVGSPVAIDFPIVDPLNLTPGAAVITMMGYAPLLQQGSASNLHPGPATVTMTGFAPTVTQNPTNLHPGIASIVMTGYAPTITNGGQQNIFPTPASIVFQGYAPEISQGAFDPDNPNVATVSAKGAHPGFIRRFTKAAADSDDYDVDFSPYLTARTDTLDDFDLTVPVGLTYSNPRHHGGIARVRLSGGTSGRSYTVGFVASTTEGRVKRVSIQIRVRG